MTLQQTDTSTGSDGGTAQCSGLTTNVPNSRFLRIASKTGTPGTGTNTVILSGNVKGAAIRAAIMFACPTGEPGLTDLPSGNYVIRLNITTGNSNLVWDAAYVCRVNSSNINQSTVGSLTGQAISLTTTGVKTMTISGSHQASVSSSDKLYFVIALKNNSAIAQSIAFKPDQLIDTPLDGIVLTLTFSDTAGFSLSNTGSIANPSLIFSDTNIFAFDPPNNVISLSNSFLETNNIIFSSSGEIINPTITFSEIAGFIFDPPSNSISLPKMFSGTTGFILTNNIDIVGFTTFNAASQFLYDPPNNNINLSNIFSETAAFTFDPPNNNINLSLLFSETADFILDDNLLITFALSLSSTNTLILTGNANYFKQIEFDNISNIGFSLSGIIIEQSLTLISSNTFNILTNLGVSSNIIFSETNAFNLTTLIQFQTSFIYHSTNDMLINLGDIFLSAIEFDGTNHFNFGTIAQLSPSINLTEHNNLTFDTNNIYSSSIIFTSVTSHTGVAIFDLQSTLTCSSSCSFNPFTFDMNSGWFFKNILNRDE